MQESRDDLLDVELALRGEGKRIDAVQFAIQAVGDNRFHRRDDDWVGGPSKDGEL